MPVKGKTCAAVVPEIQRSQYGDAFRRNGGLESVSELGVNRRGWSKTPVKARLRPLKRSASREIILTKKAPPLFREAGLWEIAVVS